MNIYRLIVKRRSIRAFKQKAISLKILTKLIDSARLAPSGANLQPLEYLVINDKDILKDVFETLKWAGYIWPEGVPNKGKRPVAYILILVNTLIRQSSYEWDIGAAMENMILTALGEGIGSCWIGSIDKPRLSKILNIPKHLLIDSILALGYPAENPKIERIEADCKYWKDPSGRLHVPKKSLESIMHLNKM